MPAKELLEGIIDLNSLVDNFPPGSELRNHFGVPFIYNPSQDLRWQIHDIYSQWERLHRIYLELQAQTSGGTWHILAGAFQAINPDTEEKIETAFVIQAMEHRNSPPYQDRANNVHLSYGYSDGRLRRGWQGGYYGNHSEVAADLQRFRALAVYPDNLPHEINVGESVKSVEQAFLAGSFDIPPITLPAPKVSTQTLSQRTTLRQRLNQTARRFLRLE